MNNKAKKILIKANKGLVLSKEDEDILFNPNIVSIGLSIKYVNDVSKVRNLKFEKILEQYCEEYESLWGIDESEISFYIRKILKGPWPKMEKYLSDPFLQKYKIFLEENNFQEHLI